MRLILIALLLFQVIMACSTIHKELDNALPPVPTPSPTPATTEQVLESLSPTIDLAPPFSFACSNCTAKELASIENARKIILEVRASKCFSDFMLFRKLIQTNGKTNDEVLEHIKSWKSATPIPIKFYSPGLFQSKGVIGYTYPNDPTIYLNRSYRNKYVWSDFAEASNLFHEALGHKAGYDHDFKATAQRQYSVPYSLNRAVELCTGK